MKTCDYDQLVVVHDEKEGIRETAEEGAADVFVNNGELPWVVAHALNNSVYSLAETTA